MKFIEACFGQIKTSLSNSMLGKNIEMQYYLRNETSSSRNIITDSNIETPDTNFKPSNIDSAPILMAPKIPIFPSSADPES